MGFNLLDLDQFKSRVSPQFYLSWMGAILIVGINTTKADPLPNTLPTNPSVTFRDAIISQSANKLTINTRDVGANVSIINWDTFSVGKDATVEFVQTGLGSAVLNKVTSSYPTEIYGQLISNGQVYLVNPNGIVFGQGSQINVGGLIASTLDMTPSDDWSKYYFSGPNNSSALIRNDGLIKANSPDGKGFVVFLAPQIINNGQIDVKGLDGLADGTTLFISASESTVEFSSESPYSEILSYTLDKGVVNGLIENAGSIFVGAGRAILSAKSMDSISVINQTGVIDATGISTKGGEIRIVADGGEINLGGHLDASSQSGEGGVIQVSGGQVNLRTGFKVDASGAGDSLTSSLINITSSEKGLVLVDLEDTQLRANNLTLQGTAIASDGITMSRSKVSASNLVIKGRSKNLDHAGVVIEDSELQGGSILVEGTNAVSKGDGVIIKSGVKVSSVVGTWIRGYDYTNHDNSNIKINGSLEKPITFSSGGEVGISSYGGGVDISNAKFQSSSIHVLNDFGGEQGINIVDSTFSADLIHFQGISTIGYGIQLTKSTASGMAVYIDGSSLLLGRDVDIQAKNYIHMYADGVNFQGLGPNGEKTIHLKADYQGIDIRGGSKGINISGANITSIDAPVVISNACEGECALWSEGVWRGVTIQDSKIEANNSWVQVYGVSTDGKDIFISRSEIGSSDTQSVTIEGGAYSWINPTFYSDSQDPVIRIDQSSLLASNQVVVKVDEPSDGTGCCDPAPIRFSGRVEMEHSLLTAHTVQLETYGNLIESDSSSIQSNNLVLLGDGGKYFITSPSNAIDNLVANAGEINFVNSKEFSVGAVYRDDWQHPWGLSDMYGVYASGKIRIVSSSGNIYLNSGVTSGDTGSSADGKNAAIIIQAGASRGAQDASGGDVVLSDYGWAEAGAGGQILFYSGSVSGAAGFKAYFDYLKSDEVPIELRETGPRYRYGSTEGSPNFTTGLDSGHYLIYREQPVVNIQSNTVTQTYTGNPYVGNPGFTVNGLQNDDVFSEAFSGSVQYSGNAIGAIEPGQYQIAPSGLVSLIGYGINYKSATLTIESGTGGGVPPIPLPPPPITVTTPPSLPPLSQTSPIDPGQQFLPKTKNPGNEVIAISPDQQSKLEKVIKLVLSDPVPLLNLGKGTIYGLGGIAPNAHIFDKQNSIGVITRYGDGKWRAEKGVNVRVDEAGLHVEPADFVAKTYEVPTQPNKPLISYYIDSSEGIPLEFNAYLKDSQLLIRPLNNDAKLFVSSNRDVLIGKTLVRLIEKENSELSGLRNIFIDQEMIEEFF